MQTSCPVDSNVAFASVEACGTFHCSTCADPTELEQTIEDRAIVSDIVLALLASKVLHVVWGNFVEKVDVLVRVELRHFVLRGWFGALSQIRK
jgi:hypothetical protein